MRDSAKDKDCLPYENARNANAIFHHTRHGSRDSNKPGERFEGCRSFAKKLHRKKVRLLPSLAGAAPKLRSATSTAQRAHSDVRD
jgi:hypothetical protein